MKKLALITAVVAALAVLVSCSSTRYSFDRDSRHDFSGYSSYAWFKLASPPEKATPPTAANTILTRRIHRAIDGELGARGFEKAPVGDADFLVTYSLVLNPRMVLYHTGWVAPYGYWGCCGWGWGAGWRGGHTAVNTYTEGTIVVDVLDTGNRQLVWRGTADGAFTGSNPSDEKIRKVVARVLQAFPPA